MLRTTMIGIFKEIWPMILVFCVVIALMRITYLIKNKEKIVFYKEMLSLGFIIYIMCLFYVVTFQDVNWSTSNYVPFKEMFRYDFGSKLFFKNVIGNMLMFLPYGFFISYFLKSKKPYLIFFLTLVASVTIETMQSMIGRVFDIDDILLNLAGGVIGFYLYHYINKLKQHLPKLLKNNVIYNIIMMLMLIGIILYLLEIINVGV